MTDLEYTQYIVDQLDDWVNELARPIVPPRQTSIGEKYVRLELQQHLPHTVMVGKLVRATSAMRAAFALAQIGFVTEAGALLRMVSDFCTEIGAIAGALNRGGKLPKAINNFVDQYFTPKARTPGEYSTAERARYVSRKDLIEADIYAVEADGIDVERLRSLRRFLNMAGDAYVHGAYETTMELYDPRTGRFFIQGHPVPQVRREHFEFAALKLHEVVVAIELTAAVTSTAGVFKAARDARREMDGRKLWRIPDK